MKTVALRFANCYGPYSEHKPSIIPRFIKRAEEEKPLIIYGDGSQTRDFIHADDVCQAIYLALTATPQTKRTLNSQSQADDLYGGVFQIGTGIQTSINELAELVKEIAENKLQIIYEAERKGEVKKNYSNINKARTVLGFEPNIKLEEGLGKLWHSYFAKVKQEPL